MKARYEVDPDDPRAPPLELWDAMSAIERARVVDALPSEFPRTSPPEGDAHRVPKEKAREALGEFFRRKRRRVYLSSELPVYYPGEAMFAPDLVAVLDVDPGPRLRWVTAVEGKGLDFALEVTLRGDRHKDLELNVERCARLGIPEYFVLDLQARRILGHRLDVSRRAYAPVVPQAGRWESEVLGVDLALEEGRVRFYVGSAPLLEAEELVGRLEGHIERLTERERRLEAEAAALEEQVKQLEAGRAAAEAGRAEAEARARALADRLRSLGVDPDDG